MEARCDGRASGDVTAMTMRKSAIEPLEENHLCPSISQLSPSRVARVCSCVGSEPGVCGSVMLKALRRSPASSGCSQRSFCSSVPAIARISELPESGAALPNASGAMGDVPSTSCMSPRRTWPIPWPPSSGGRCVAHSPRSLTCSRSGAIASVRPSIPSSCQIVSSGHISSRTKSRDPLELLLVVGVGGEVPAHLIASFRWGARARPGSARGHRRQAYAVTVHGRILGRWPCPRRCA